MKDASGSSVLPPSPAEEEQEFFCKGLSSAARTAATGSSSRWPHALQRKPPTDDNVGWSAGVDLQVWVAGEGGSRRA